MSMAAAGLLHVAITQAALPGVTLHIQAIHCHVASGGHPSGQTRGLISLAGPPLRNEEGSGVILLHELCNRKLIFKHRLRNLTTDAKLYENVNKYG